MGWSRWTPLVSCEHAGHAVPDDIDLGISHEALRSHVSYDRGAREIALALAEQLDAPLHLGEHSRLVVDLNRREGNPVLILAESHGVPVPGNVALSAEERSRRVETYHRPYRERARADARRLAASGGCLHLSIHSFDPAVAPMERTFAAGVLFDTEREPEATIAAGLAEALRATGRDVRLNQPYTGTPEGLTSWLRDQLPPAAYVGIEIEASQGWMDRPGALEAFAEALAEAAARLPLPLP